ncbi:MAG: hypothetical protein JW914_00850 [Syntrophaceae bacterium]|nr:hypothetical protein [Syntrophaceae bacterium]
MKKTVIIFLVFVASIIWGLCEVRVFAGDKELPSCAMQPLALSINLPDKGFAWIPESYENGACGNIPKTGWQQGRHGNLNLYVHTEGPEGSGRFWSIRLGVEEKEYVRPPRGVCMATSTIGWRTLQRYSKGTLPWLADVNGDGNAEFIFWRGFPLFNKRASLAVFGLMAWVYRPVSKDLLVLDEELSRSMAKSLAKEFRLPIENLDINTIDLREQAADELEKFADKKCSILKR